MGASIEDYLEIYKQACTAYAQQNYDVAATLVDQVVQNLPDDPNSHLLRGHIYYVLQQYDIAKAEYQKVLQLTDNKEIIGFAKHGIESINQYQGNSSDRLVTPENYQQISTEDLAHSTTDLNTNSFDNKAFDEYEAVADGIEELSLDSPFNISANSSTDLNSQSDSAASFSDDPFKLDNQATEQDSQSKSWEAEADLELPAFWQEDETENSIEHSSTNNPFVDSGANSLEENDSDSSFAEIDLSISNSWEIPTEFLIGEQYNPPEDLDFNSNSLESDNFAKIPTSVRDNGVKTNNLPSSHHEQIAETTSHNWLGPIEAEDSLKEVSAASRDLPPEEKLVQKGVKVETSNLDLDDNFDLDAFESAFGSDSFTPDEEPVNQPQASNSQSNIEFLDEFDDFDDLGNLPGFDISDADSSFSDVAMHSGSLDMASNSDSYSAEPLRSNENSDREDELFSITGSQEAMPIFTQVDVAKLEPVVSVEQSWLAPLENAPLEKKQWLIAGSVGIVSSLVVAIVSFGATNFSPPQQRESVRNTGWAMSLAAGLAGFATAAFMGNFTIKQIRRTTENLQAQFDAVRQGNLNVQATVYSEDELGLLATGFNEMARVIFTTTNEAQRKADEQEEAKENLQRQVIRLLDDVEGAARGDLTVQAEVTADVLGAVADAFNLTIQNLRDIVQQVKVAAKEVTKGATNSETFARALSSDALRQAEELAVTLNSVQVMTDSIQRVAEAAREAEAVARDASTIALKGGEAVENTVAGILEIRETVAETTRKVKRLAESSQEISKIVALISQIASRTNLLALNASIEAARAGEAGRGFAIVADEVRQLADKSAKSLKEIEQIVMQIQSETGSVMTAMEEGTQQVIKGTKLAEEAKRSLENIIQVANRIDILVRSITSDTVEQTETSRAVAHVMQSVELTAQETSQEAQRVSGALQNLVGVSRDLIASVERFRVETLESR
ncbi:HAMP domain-containing protein [Calothrix sp. FACHB-1219]|uniref:methyl-accepting chemotaxis protein n=1 Tax=unclassified Calothrix TaxID=2619626 RepID=UPI0016838C89|nr:MULTISPECIES: methyl-accepting chemotaxis protein [unclassified Calothrix]MBD2207714.1 HAMP domain-containing protein [Calothrix sp. FACHB-168]MBD2222318.1 HAMP domain-containing protein [Calothrix sp. FACHB-1219]